MNVNGASVLVPTAGKNFTEIQAYVAKNTSKDPVTREAASIVVMNGTETIIGKRSRCATEDNCTVYVNAPSDYATNDCIESTKGYERYS